MRDSVCIIYCNRRGQGKSEQGSLSAVWPSERVRVRREREREKKRWSGTRWATDISSKGFCLFLCFVKAAFYLNICCDHIYSIGHTHTHTKLCLWIGDKTTALSSESYFWYRAHWRNCFQMLRGWFCTIQRTHRDAKQPNDRTKDWRLIIASICFCFLSFPLCCYVNKWGGLMAVDRRLTLASIPVHILISRRRHCCALCGARVMTFFAYAVFAMWSALAVKRSGGGRRGRRGH